RLQPVGDGFQITGVAAKLAHARRQLAVWIDETRRHVLRRHGHEVLGCMDVDPRCMPMCDDQIGGLSALGAPGDTTHWLARVGLAGRSDTTNLFARSRHDLSSLNELT